MQGGQVTDRMKAAAVIAGLIAVTLVLPTMLYVQQNRREAVSVPPAAPMTESPAVARPGPARLGASRPKAPPAPQGPSEDECEAACSALAAKECPGARPDETGLSCRAKCGTTLAIPSCGK